MKSSFSVFVKWLFLAVVSLLLVGSVGAATVKIGIIDTQRVMTEALAAKAAKAILLDDLKDKRETFNKKQEEVRTLEQELEQKEKDLDPAVVKYKQEQLAQEVKNLRRLKVDLEDELNKKNTELTQQIAREIWLIVDEFRKKENYTLILEKKSVVTFSDAVDITDKILNLYDAKEKK